MSTSDRAMRRGNIEDFRKSFLRTRLLVGAVGVALPLVLVIGNPLLFGEPWNAYPALSDYYYTPMRNWLVGSLFALGGGLVVYVATRANRRDTWLSSVAGVLAVLVALFPTDPLRKEVTVTGVLHLIFASGFLALLGVICWRFGTRDGRDTRFGERHRRFWRRVHHGLALTIWVAIVGIGASAVFGVLEDSAPLVLQFVAVLAFGASWFLKGAEIFGFTPIGERSRARAATD